MAKLDDTKITIDLTDEARENLAHVVRAVQGFTRAVYLFGVLVAALVAWAWVGHP